MYTIVTAFLDVGRASWKGFERSVDYYLERAKRVFTLDDFMVIYVQPELVDFVKEQRDKYRHKTKVIPLTIEELPYFKYKNQIEQVMQSAEFKNGLAVPICPEVTQPLYDVIMWSKIPLVVRTIEENPFNSSHFVWLDFGIHTEVLKDFRLNKPLLSFIPDKIKLLCLRYPLQADLNVKKFFKAHSIRFTGTMITGSAENFKILNQYWEQEIQYCLNQNVVDNDQSLLCIIFLKHPELFELYYGFWTEQFSNYYQVTRNLVAVLHIAFTCKEEGRVDIYEDILRNIKNYTSTMWEF